LLYRADFNMSRIWVLLSALLLGGCSALDGMLQRQETLTCESAQGENSLQSEWQSIGENVWLMQGVADAISTPRNKGRISNVVFVAESSGKVHRGWLVGSGPDAETGRALACSIKRDLAHDITDVISPRAIPESVLGAAALAPLNHWALPEVQAAMGERCERCVKRLEAAIEARRPLVDHIALPNRLITDSVLGPFDVMPVTTQPGQAIALLYHRASDIWILPGVVWGRNLVPDAREADATHLLHILDQLLARHPGTVVPEQGPAAGAGQIELNRHYWQNLLETLQLLWRNGENQPGTTSGLSALEQNAVGPEGRLRDQLNVQRVWQHIENDGFDGPSVGH
jgi:hypothetical protein